MKRAYIAAMILVLRGNLDAQNNMESVLMEVEKNNTSLASFRKNIDAEIIGNKTGLYPQNPEAEFNYLWGHPGQTGNRTDFTITQSFDFPTAYVNKARISNLKNEQAELEYQKQRLEIMFQTRVVCIRLIYRNALNIVLNNRYTSARKVADAYEAKYMKGDASILDLNKARVNFLNVSKELESNEIERNTLLAELTGLNGGNSISFTDSLLVIKPIPDDFEQWIAQTEPNNPILQWFNKELAVTSQQVALSRSMGLPGFYAGYMSEKVIGQHFQGMTVGITIPLFENKNTGKYARAKSLAIQSIYTDARSQFYNDMKAKHAKVVSLQKSVSDYRNKLSILNNRELVEKALEKGEISLTEFIYELSFYNESINRILETEMDLNLAFAELSQFQ